MYSNLVLSGGALRAVALLGAVKYLEELDILKNIKQFIGTSAGSIISFLIIIGYKSSEIVQLLIEKSDLLTDFDFNNLTNILEDYGLDDCSRNKKILEDSLFKKIKQESITFLELTKKFGVNFVVTGSNLTTRETDYFNVDTYPEMNVIDALLISSCIPLIYQPIKFNDCLYIDGGIYENLPLKYLKKNSNETLGIYVQTYYSNKNENFYNYFTNIISSVMDKLSYDEILNSDYNICLIFYKEPRSSDINFNMDDLELIVNKEIFKKYYDYGYKEFKNYYDELLRNKDLEVNNIVNRN
jgi:NTE family protein|tara:strand:+ start:962 stop:1855 length:894 start_codon:yes stop_codon:yes gene_type:complete